MNSVSRRFVCRAALALSCCLSALAARAESGFDLAGIRTGELLAQAESVIDAAWPGAQKEAITAHDGMPLGFRYSSATPVLVDGRVGKAQIVLGLAAGDRVWFVGRVQSFDAALRPDYATLKKSLLDRFGPPSRPAPDAAPVKYPRLRYGILWSFDAGGLPVAATDFDLAKDVCADAFLGDNHSLLPGAPLLVPRTLGARCGVAVTASVSFDEQAKSVTAYSVTIADGAVFRAGR